MNITNLKSESDGKREKVHSIEREKAGGKFPLVNGIKRLVASITPAWRESKPGNRQGYFSISGRIKSRIEERDNRLVAQAMKCWDYKDLDNLEKSAWSQKAKVEIRRRSIYVYHREEYSAGMI